MLVDVLDRKYIVPEDKIKIFMELLKFIMNEDVVEIHSLQRLLGKAVSFGIAVPNSLLFCREGYKLITQAEQKGEEMITVTVELKEELAQFLCLEKDWNGSSWRQPGHASVKIYTDAAEAL
eukprot:Lithocolla_globosa_v1_NODE_4615_length_1399_cov_592.279762.p2 type:complete len:121 gc:universal NODE_4615_length_1399_cov_592.279762:221-583(+)